MGDKAAIVGTETEHSTAPLTGGPGSPNVLINGISAWRAEADTHKCPEHSDETVYAGSESVLINGRRAVRESDFLESNGAGAPNRVNSGSPNVLIGTVPVGLMSPEAMAEYCAAICDLKKNWDNLTPEERQAQYTAAVNAQFDRMGMPHPEFEMFSTAENPGVGAYWNQGKWLIGLPDNTFTGNFNEWTMKNATYHELRHAEQTVTALRERAGRATVCSTRGGSRAEGPWWKFWYEDVGSTEEPVDAETLVSISGVPYEVAQRAIDNPILPGTPEARYGRTNAEQHLNDAGKKRSREVNGSIWDASGDLADAKTDEEKAEAREDLRAAREAYDHLPGGSDAGAAADALAAFCTC